MLGPGGNYFLHKGQYLHLFIKGQYLQYLRLKYCQFTAGQNKDVSQFSSKLSRIRVQLVRLKIVGVASPRSQ